MEVHPNMPAFTYLDEKTKEEMKKEFTNFELVLVGEEKWAIPVNYTKFGHLYYNFKVRSDDTWLVSSSRSGSTLTSELLWLINNNLDFKTAKSIRLRDRYPFLDYSLIRSSSEGSKHVQPSYEFIEKMPSPRFAKTHFSLSSIPELLPSNCKIVYIVRNPKDVAVSYFEFCRKVYNYNGSFEKFWNYFENGLITFTPYWKHAKEAWDQRNNENVLFIFYEELINQPLATYTKVGEFFGKSYTENQYKELMNHLMFSNFKSNNMVNDPEDLRIDNFIRQGKSGSWHSMFTPELRAQANRWIERNLKETDMVFPYVDIYS